MKKIIFLALLIFSLKGYSQIIKVFGNSGFNLNGNFIAWANATDTVLKVKIDSIIINKPVKGVNLVTSLTTTGSSGAATFTPATGVLNIPSYSTNLLLRNIHRIVFANSPYTILSTDDVLEVDTGGGNIIVNIDPTAGKILHFIKRVTSDANTVTITPLSGLIDNAASKVISNAQGCVQLVSNNTNLDILSVY